MTENLTGACKAKPQCPKYFFNAIKGEGWMERVGEKNQQTNKKNFRKTPASRNQKERSYVAGE